MVISDFRLAVKNMGHRIKGARVFTQSLARIKRKKRYISDIFFINVLLTMEPSA